VLTATPSSDNDLDLVARVLADDDRRAFADLVRRHEAAVRAFLVRVARGDHALADDLAQETFVECYRSLARFRGGSQFRTWLLGIAYNRLRSELRRRRPHEAWEGDALPADSAPELDLAAPPPSEVVDLRSDLATALARLPADERAAIHLCYHEGLSHAEAACVLDCPLGTVKTNVLRAKDKLRVLMQAWAPA
jgi:RNA polymerase sigma factor (sigma-70 family)